MEYFTALVIAYTLQQQPVETLIIFESRAQCEEALRASGPLYDAIDRDYEETSMKCERSGVASRWTVRPKMRPDHLNKETK